MSSNLESKNRILFYKWIHKLENGEGDSSICEEIKTFLLISHTSWWVWALLKIFIVLVR
jgi:hypothetical protein